MPAKQITIMPPKIILTPHLPPWSAKRLAEDETKYDQQRHHNWGTTAKPRIVLYESQWETTKIIRCPGCGGIVCGFGSLARVRCAHEVDASDTRDYARKCGWSGLLTEAYDAAQNPEAAKAKVDARLKRGKHPWSDEDYKVEAWNKGKRKRAEMLKAATSQMINGRVSVHSRAVPATSKR